jgi:dihydroorotase
MRILIRNGRVIDPANNVDDIRDLAIQAGEILAHTPDSFNPQREIDASGKIVCPGLIDLRARLREPGQEHKTTIAAETRAAAANGITTLCCPPDTDPVIDTPAVAELIRQRAEAAGQARVLPLGAMTPGLDGEHISEMVALSHAGCAAMAHERPIANTQVMRRAMLYAASHNILLMLNPVDPWLANDGCAHDGPIASQLGLPGIPAAAETAAVAREIALIEETGARSHFELLSGAQSTRKIARARFDGVPITAAVCAHQLFLTEQDIMDFNSACHVLPPLRSQADRDALRKAVADGTIDAICSDHQPHEKDAKLAPFCATASGISGLDTLLALTLKLVDEQVLDLNTALARLTSGPASVLGIDSGHLGSGARADICIIDPNVEYTLTADNMYSQGKNTPFLGQTFRGRVTTTLVNGKIVFEK